MDLIKENDISIVTVSREFVQKTDLEGVKIHLKLNTGMNRIGVNVSEAKEVHLEICCFDSFYRNTHKCSPVVWLIALTFIDQRKRLSGGIWKQ